LISILLEIHIEFSILRLVVVVVVVEKVNLTNNILRNTETMPTSLRHKSAFKSEGNSISTTLALYLFCLIAAIKLLLRKKNKVDGSILGLEFLCRNNKNKN